MQRPRAVQCACGCPNRMRQRWERAAFCSLSRGIPWVGGVGRFEREGRAQSGGVAAVVAVELCSAKPHVSCMERGCGGS
eukprot:3528929-Alexandrium_andersonii.AAC.1